VLPEIFKNRQHQIHKGAKFVGCGGGLTVHLQFRDNLSLLPDVLMGIKDMPVRFDKMVCLGKDHSGILGNGRRRLVAKGPRSTAKTDPAKDEAAKERPCLFDSRWLVAKAVTDTTPQTD
jgi:hypothetical protein